jgi:hypothetical protein
MIDAQSRAPGCSAINATMNLVMLRTIQAIE